MFYKTIYHQRVIPNEFVPPLEKFFFDFFHFSTKGSPISEIHKFGNLANLNHQGHDEGDPKFWTKHKTTNIDVDATNL